MDKIFKFFNKEYSGLHEAAYLLAVFSFLSHILALVRDRLLAHNFGAGQTLDIYYASFRIPDFIYITVASFVAITVLIPFLVDRIKDDNERAKKFLDDVFTVFSITIIIVSVVAFFLIPVLAGLVAPGISGEAKSLMINLSRIMLLSPILLGFSNLLGSVTQSLRKFFVFATGPILYNLGIVIGILLFRPLFGIYGVVMGVVLGALLHLLIQFPVVIKYRLFPWFSKKINWSEIKKVAGLSLPRTIALSSGQLTLIVLVALASLMIEGSISIFNLSFNLQSVPLTIIGVSYSVAAFPTLARLFSNGESKQFARHLINAGRHIIFWSFPAIVLFIVLRAQIVRTILGTGQFSWNDTRLTAAALAIFAVSILAQSLVLLFVRGYYAAGKTFKPLVINIFSAGLTILLAFIFVKIFDSSEMFRYFTESLLRLEGVQGGSVIMLAFAYSVGMIVNATLLWFFFSRDFKEFDLSVENAFVQSFSASIIMGFVSYQVLGLLDGILNTETLLGIFSQGAIAGITGITVGIIVLKLVNNREIKEVQKSIKQKIWKITAIFPSQREL